MYPWHDPRGHWSPFKTLVFALLFVPAVLVASDWIAGNLGGRPINEALRGIGDWTIRLIFLSLAITPLRQVLKWQGLILVRRMIGVAAFAYIVSHVVLYSAQEMFDLRKVAIKRL